MFGAWMVREDANVGLANVGLGFYLKKVVRGKTFSSRRGLEKNSCSHRFGISARNQATQTTRIGRWLEPTNSYTQLWKKQLRCTLRMSWRHHVESELTNSIEFHFDHLQVAIRQTRNVAFSFVPAFLHGAETLSLKHKRKRLTYTW